LSRVYKKNAFFSKPCLYTDVFSKNFRYNLRVYLAYTVNYEAFAGLEKNFPALKEGITRNGV
jgi:hypothetical protein